MVENTLAKPTLKVEKIWTEAALPEKPGSKTDSGFDVRAMCVHKIYAHGGGNGEVVLEGDAMKDKFNDLTKGEFELQCNERCLIGTGLKVTVAEGYEIQVRPRSGLALKRGLTVLNTPGTVK